MEIYGVSYLDQLNFHTSDRQVESLEIWLLKSSPPIIRQRTHDTDSDEFVGWLAQQGDFAPPTPSPGDEIQWTFRLLHAKFDGRSFHFYLPFTAEKWNTASDMLHLPKTYHRTLGKNDPTPLTVIMEAPGNDSAAGLTVHTSPSPTQATMALNYDPKHRITRGFFGYMSLDGPGLGEAVLDMLRVAADKISEPLIVPLAMYEQLADAFQSLMLRADNGLDIFERDGRFIEHGLGRYSGGDYDLTTPHGFDEIHKTVVNQHARLTNRSTRFLNLFGSSLERGISILECHFGGNPADQAGAERLYDGSYSRQCLQAMLNRSDYTYGLRELLLQRVSVYLQVVQNFMQQEISRETKRDSSAMKSLSLLTMVFLPATAVATIMAPFTKISDDEDTLRIITGQFWKFWAVAGPITLVVLIAWVCWIQRIHVRNALAIKMEQLKQIEMLQRRTKAADAESDAGSTGTTSSSSNSTRQPSVLSRRSAAAGGSGSIRRSAASIREQGSVKDTGSIRGSIVAETSNSQRKSVVLTQKEKQ